MEDAHTPNEFDDCVDRDTRVKDSGLPAMEDAHTPNEFYERVVARVKDLIASGDTRSIHEIRKKFFAPLPEEKQ